MKNMLIDILKTLLFIFRLKKFPTYQQADNNNEIIFAMKTRLTQFILHYRVCA